MMDGSAPLSTTQVQLTLGALCFSCLAVVAAKKRGISPSSSLLPTPPEFHAFQKSYLCVYLLCTFSDWLKGPYVYALYVEYGFSQVEIAWLFAGGFLSSLVFGTIAGSLSDKFGRKNMCLLFCLVYGASAFTKLINSFFWLFFGRVLSGIATSLLFTTFESWMVAEHHSRQFPEALIANTFSKAILGNGIVAVGAGLVAQLAASLFGYVAPFLVAVPCLALAGFMMRGWQENYGNASASPLETFVRGYESVKRERKLQLLGTCQALFEGAMYVWVFYWTPCLTSPKVDHAGNELPFGLIFACFMCAMMIGGTVTDMAPLEHVTLPLHSLAVVSMVVGTVLYDNKLIVFLSFVLFEGLVGTYFGAHGTLRSTHIEEASRASVMNIFRIPLNAIVLGTITLEFEPKTVLGILSVVLASSLASFVAFRKVVTWDIRNDTSR